MRVLIVDDNSETRGSLAAVVRSCGFSQVFTASDGDEALSKLASVRPGLIISDCQMPGMDGIRLVRALRAAGVVIPIVMCSSVAEPAMLAAAMDAGASEFLPKSAIRTRLPDVIRDVLHPISEAA